VSEHKHERVVPRGRAMAAQVATAVAIVFALLAAVFVLQNTAQATIHFLFWSARVAIAGALLLALALGALIGFLVAYVRQWQYRRGVRREHRLHRETAAGEQAAAPVQAPPADAVAPVEPPAEEPPP
jgi:uncharacterized integral membrane protein